MTHAMFMKFAAGVLLFGMWLGLVLAHVAPPPALIDAIGYALVGLGIYHAAAADGQITLKFIAGVLLFAAWFTLVVRGLAPPAGLINAIAYTLAGLGIYQAKNAGSLVPFVTGLLGGSAGSTTADRSKASAAVVDTGAAGSTEGAGAVAPAVETQTPVIAAASPPTVQAAAPAAVQ